MSLSLLKYFLITKYFLALAALNEAKAIKEATY